MEIKTETLDSLIYKLQAAFSCLNEDDFQDFTSQMLSIGVVQGSLENEEKETEDKEIKVKRYLKRKLKANLDSIVDSSSKGDDLKFPPDCLFSEDNELITKADLVFKTRHPDFIEIFDFTVLGPLFYGMQPDYLYIYKDELSLSGTFIVDFYISASEIESETKRELLSLIKVLFTQYAKSKAQLPSLQTMICNFIKKKTRLSQFFMEKHLDSFLERVFHYNSEYMNYLKKQKKAEFIKLFLSKSRLFFCVEELTRITKLTLTKYFLFEGMGREQDFYSFWIIFARDELFILRTAFGFLKRVLPDELPLFFVFLTKTTKSVKKTIFSENKEVASSSRVLNVSDDVSF